GNVVLDRPFHHGKAVGDVDRALGPLEINVGDLRHRHLPPRQAATSFMETPRSASLLRSIGRPEPISWRAPMNSAGALTASTARITSPFRWNTANLAAAGSPRTSVSSASSGTPAIWSFRSYWSDQFQVTSCAGSGRPA